jgi:hypothetical protein
MVLMVKSWQIMLCMDVEEWVQRRNERHIGNLVVGSWAKESEWTWEKADQCFVAESRGTWFDLSKGNLQRKDLMM